MAVYKVPKKNAWYVDFKYKDDLTGEWKHICKRGFSSSKDARQWERENRDVVRVNDPSKVYTFDDIFKLWVKSTQCSKTSEIRYAAHISQRFTGLRYKKISKITKSDLMEWRTWLVSSDYATLTKNHTITLVRSVFKFASDMYDIPNPSTCLTRFKQTDEELLKEMNVWTPEEFEIFASCVEDPEYRLFFEFLFWTGVRRGEGIAVQKRDVKNGWVTIKYSQRTNKEGLKPTKTKQTRKIKLDDKLWDDLQPLLSVEGPYLFGGKEGLPPTTVERIFKQAIKKSGVQQIRMHDLRHSHATWLINSGVNVVAVSKRLGHASIEQTLKTYTHLLEFSDQLMMDTINAYREGNFEGNELQKEEIEEEIENLEKTHIYAENCGSETPAATTTLMIPVIRTKLQ